MASSVVSVVSPSVIGSGTPCTAPESMVQPSGRRLSVSGPRGVGDGAPEEGPVELVGVDRLELGVLVRTVVVTCEVTMRRTSR